MLFALNMARITAMVCECESKMKRMYVRAKGGSGWEPVGWQCDCGCVCMADQMADQMGPSETDRRTDRALLRLCAY